MSIYSVPACCRYSFLDFSHNKLSITLLISALQKELVYYLACGRRDYRILYWTIVTLAIDVACNNLQECRCPHCLLIRKARREDCTLSFIAPLFNARKQNKWQYWPGDAGTQLSKVGGIGGLNSNPFLFSKVAKCSSTFFKCTMKVWIPKEHTHVQFPLDNNISPLARSA